MADTINKTRRPALGYKNGANCNHPHHQQPLGGMHVLILNLKCQPAKSHGTNPQFVQDLG